MRDIRVAMAYVTACGTVCSGELVRYMLSTVEHALILVWARLPISDGVPFSFACCCHASWSSFLFLFLHVGVTHLHVGVTGSCRGSVRGCTLLHAPMYQESTYCQPIVCGVVTWLQVVIDRETGRSKGYGFVKFDDTRDASDAIASCHGKVSVYLHDWHLDWAVVCMPPALACIAAHPGDGPHAPLPGGERGREEGGGDPQWCSKDGNDTVLHA